MYIPKYYREEDRQKILAFLKQNNFPAIVSFDGERPIATHTPVEVVENENGKVTIYAHISRGKSTVEDFRQPGNTPDFSRCTYLYFTALV